MSHKESETSIKYPYGKDKNNNVVHVEEADHGVNYGCLDCTGTLRKREGSLTPHFFHYIRGVGRDGRPCRGGGPSGLHEFAKDLFVEHLGKWKIGICCRICKRQVKSHRFRENPNVFKEKNVVANTKTYRPDILVDSAEGQIVVEIVVTNVMKYYKKSDLFGKYGSDKVFEFGAKDVESAVKTECFELSCQGGLLCDDCRVLRNRMCSNCSNHFDLDHIYGGEIVCYKNAYYICEGCVSPEKCKTCGNFQAQIKGCLYCKDKLEKEERDAKEAAQREHERQIWEEKLERLRKENEARLKEEEEKHIKREQKAKLKREEEEAKSKKKEEEEEIQKKIRESLERVRILQSQRNKEIAERKREEELKIQKEKERIEAERLRAEREEWNQRIMRNRKMEREKEEAALASVVELKRKEAQNPSHAIAEAIEKGEVWLPLPGVTQMDCKEAAKSGAFFRGGKWFVASVRALLGCRKWWGDQREKYTGVARVLNSRSVGAH